MRIIRDATAKEYTCTYCGSLLEVTDKDLWHKTHEYDNHIIYIDYYICPCCGNSNNINVEGDENK